MKTVDRKEIAYPSEVIFKAVFNNLPYTKESIVSILTEEVKQGDVAVKASTGGKFLSYTIKAEFNSEEELQAVCSMIAGLEGFKMLF
jgi:putative lipoic acid-binding regulatory protein